jgi:hypothetical protein
MARWTSSYNEQKQFAQINRDIPIFGRVQIILHNEKIIEGLICGHRVGNNAGQGGWEYYGVCEVAVGDGPRLLIDYLDIKSIVEIRE